MADEYTPTTEHVRETYATYDGDWQPDFAEDFDRWLAAHDRATAARAWDEGYQDGQRQATEGDDGPRYTNPYREGGAS